jgi:phosphoenolpyruvate carboxylase
MRAMTEAEFLSRIDQHLAQGNEIMARSNEVMARSDETMARSNELHEGYRQFMRDIMRRLEIFGRDLSREMHEIRAETRANTSVLSELSEDIRSQRGALLTVIDELRGHGMGGRG